MGDGDLGEAGVTARTLLVEAWDALAGDPGWLERVRLTGPPGTLPSRLPVTAMAQASAAAAGLAAVELAAARGGSPAGVRVDSRRTAVAFISERHLRIDGAASSLFDPLSRFLPAADGWVRLHGNYPHHRARLYAALGVDPADPDPAAAVARTVAGLPAQRVEDLVSARGGIAAAVREPEQWRAHPQGAAAAASPLVALRPVTTGAGGAQRPVWTQLPLDPSRPAAGIRVLDLTRVIAGPVATRTLALLGADVLRVDPPGIPEIPVQHLDTGFGKRSTLLDLGVPGDRRVFEDLLGGADVLVSGYRTGALDRYGLDPDTLAARHPQLVVARHNAWGADGPWAGRRGFDSIVQAACGIARIEAGGADQPGVMPAQALDHATGYLMAAAILRALARRANGTGGWQARLSLAGTAAWLLRHAGAVSPDQGTGGDRDPGPHLAEASSAAGRLTHALPAFEVDGGRSTWDTPPVRWGSSEAAWLPRR